MRRAALLGLTLMALTITVPWHMAHAQGAAKDGGAAASTLTAPAPAADGTAVEGAPKAKAHSNNIISVILRSGAAGIMVWLFLLVCLVICIALVVDSYLTIREKEISPAAVVESVRTAIEQGDLVKAMECCKHNPGPLSNILLAGFNNVEEGFEVIQDAVSVAADIESEKLLSRVTYLSVISNTTPMLGLIGTVQGMIRAFAALGSEAAGAAQQSMLAMNISHGLWATAVGLGTAVPATIFFFFFKNKATKIILAMEALTLDIIKSLRNVEVVHN